MVALCDPWPFAKQQARDNLVWRPEPAAPIAEFGDLRHLLDTLGDTLDGVVIATPDYLHAAQARDCIERKLPVYLEPPLAMNVADAEELVALGEERGVLVQVGYQRRSQPGYRFVVEPEHRRKLFGWINIAKAHHAIPRRCRIDDPTPDPALAIPAEALTRLGFATVGDFLNWQGSEVHCAGRVLGELAHQIDLFQWALGRPRAVVAAGMRVHPDDGDWDNADVLFEFAGADGASARAAIHMEVGHTQSGKLEILHGPKATASLDQVRETVAICPETHVNPREFDRRGWLEPFLKLDGRAGQSGQPASAISCWGGSKPFYDRSLYIRNAIGGRAFCAHLENFLRAISCQRACGDPGLNCPAATALETLRTCMAVEESL